MAKRIHHMGMIVGKVEHEEFHRNAPDLNPKQHAALLKRMGITREQDEEWHRSHLTLAEQRSQGLTHVEPSAIGAGFVEWCTGQGWLVQRGKECFASAAGIRELHVRFDITVQPSPRR